MVFYPARDGRLQCLRRIRLRMFDSTTRFKSVHRRSWENTANVEMVSLFIKAQRVPRKSESHVITTNERKEKEKRHDIRYMIC